MVTRPKNVLPESNARGAFGGATVRRRQSVLRRYPFLAIGGGICLTVAFGAIFVPWLTPYDPAQQNMDALLVGPSWDHPLGTDALGRDMLSRLLYGARVSLMVALLASLAACLVGSTIGMVAGLVGNWTESILMRAMDAVYAFPNLVLAIAIIAMIGTGQWQAMTAIAIVAVPRYARMMRAQSLSVKNRDFVLAALVSGAGHFRIALRHVFPNTFGVIVVQLSAYAGFAILTEAALSFLGLGTQPPTPAWGSLLRTGYQFLSRAPWLSIAPGVLISLLVLGFNLLGDGLRDLLDPRIK